MIDIPHDDAPRGPTVFLLFGLVFLAGACVMAVEVAAGRVIARHLGQSLYSWTSVIGVVLAGISAGSYAGGWLADRFRPLRLLRALLFFSSLLCLAVPPINSLVAGSYRLMELSWPVRILLHTTAAFLLPSAALGAIPPVAARAAVTLRSGVGRTMGAAYAWGAAGSILGTFVTGYWLVDALGALGVVVSVAAVLAILAAACGRASAWALAWACACVVLGVTAFASAPAAQRIGGALRLREGEDPRVVYRDESQYSCITVVSGGAERNIRGLYLDKMMHSTMDAANPTNLLYKYAWIYEAVLDRHTPPGRPITSFVIGGGGYTFPQYVAITRPGSRIDVAEIDPAVTEAARRACGFVTEDAVRIHHMDARNFVADLVRRLRRGEDVPLYDYVFGDTFNDYSVPYHLTTEEFNEDLSELMTDDGVYLLNMIDRFDSGRFLAAIVRTYRRTFPHVCVFYCHRNLDRRGTYVVAASKRALDLEGLAEEVAARRPFYGRLLSDGEIEGLLARTPNVVLTDDYAPVENLLAPVVERDLPEELARHYIEKGLAAVLKGDLASAVSAFERALEVDPGLAPVHYNLGTAYMQQGRTDEALAAFAAAITLDPSYVDPRMNAAVLLARLGKVEAAKGELDEVLRLQPGNTDAWINRSAVFARAGRVEEAMSDLRKALEINPRSAMAHNNLGELLAARGETNAARQHFEEALNCDPSLYPARRNLELMGE